MSPDIPLKIVEWFFQFGIIGFLLGLMALFAIFRGWHFYKLLSGEPEKHKPVFDEAKALIRTEHWGSRYRAFLQKILSKLTGVIGDSYRFPDEKPRYRSGSSDLEQLRQPDTLWRVLGVNPFTPESYQFCFLLAFLYPVLSFLLTWAAGGNGSLGSLDVLPTETPFWQRWGLILGLGVSVSLAIWGPRLSGWKSIVAFTFSVVVAGVVAVAAGTGVVAGTVAIAGAFAFAFSFAFSFAGAVIVTGVVTVTVAVAVTFTGVVAFSSVIAIVASLPFYVWISIPVILAFGLQWLYEKAIKKRELATYWLVYTVLFLAAGIISLVWIDGSGVAIILLFYLVLPLVNTPLDWLSLGITRALLQSIRFNHHRFGMAVLWSLVDLVIALFALFLVSGVIVSIVSITNLFAVTPIIDLEATFTSLSSLDNWKDNLWIYFMLLSTLVPTAVHFALAGGAVTLLVTQKRRIQILKDTESNDLRAKEAWLYVSIMPAVGFVLAPTLLFYGLYWVLHWHGAWLGQTLLSWATLLATWIDPTLGHISQGAIQL